MTRPQLVYLVISRGAALAYFVWMWREWPL